MATKFSPCKGSYVLNQFPSNVMFGMNGFHVSISQRSDTGPSWPSCFLLHFQLAIIKDRHNMEKDLTLYHKVNTFIDPDKEAF